MKLINEKHPDLVKRKSTIFYEDNVRLYETCSESINTEAVFTKTNEQGMKFSKFWHSTHLFQ